MKWKKKEEKNRGEKKKGNHVPEREKWTRCNAVESLNNFTSEKRESREKHAAWD